MLWALGSYCLVVTHCFICPNVQLPMINYQSNLFSFSCIVQIKQWMRDINLDDFFPVSWDNFIQWIAVSMHLSFDQWEPSGLQSKWNCMAPFSKCTPPPPLRSNLQCPLISTIEGIWGLLSFVFIFIDRQMTQIR